MQQHTYYHFDDPDYDDYPSYIELAPDYYCLRKISDLGDTLKNTSLHVNDEMCVLPEGSWAEHLEYMKHHQISAHTFDEKWQLSKKPYLSAWQTLKTKYVIGQCVQAKIVVFYPQGIVLDWGERFYGIAPYELCKQTFGADAMYPNHHLALCLVGFDEVNFWAEFRPSNTQNTPNP